MKRGVIEVAVVFTMAIGIVTAQSVCASDVPPLRAGETGRANQSGMSDDSILGLLEAANKNEIEAGQVAQQKSADPAIKAYGHRMSQEQDMMINKGAALAKHVACDAGRGTQHEEGA